MTHPTSTEPQSVPAESSMSKKPAGTGTDEDIAEAVKHALMTDSELKDESIDVTVVDGVVDLWGTVASAALMRRASKVAASIAGVKSVNSNLAAFQGS